MRNTRRLRGMIGMMTIAMFGAVAIWCVTEGRPGLGAALGLLATYRAYVLRGQLATDDDDDG